MNKQQILAACKLSPEFFFEHYYRIIVVGGRPQLFKLRPYQREVLQAIRTHDFTIGLKARQIGWTTLAVANALHDVLFYEFHPWLFISRNEDAAQKMLAKAKAAYYRLPKWMRDALPKLLVETQSVMEFANGSRIESVPATGSTGRGDSVYGALMDECAFMEYAEEIWGAVQPLVYGPAMLFSTANGMGNFFHEIWLDSQNKDSIWQPLFYPWNVVPTRDEAWYDSTKRAFRGREWLFYQEYPSSPEEAFAKSGRVAFQYELIQNCFQPIEPYRRLEWVVGGTEPRLLADGELADIEVFQWRPPEVVRDELGRPIYKPNYVVGVDVAEGLEHGDFSYVTVFDANTGEQMLSCRSAIPVSYLDDLIAWCGYEYMTALVVVEHNNAGVLPIDRLHRDHWYPRMYRMDKFAQYAVGRDVRYGWRTTPATKPKMVNDFIYALAEGDVILHDPDFILEAQTFIADGKGGYGATAGNHDDTIMGTLIGWQGVLDSPKYPILWRDETIQPVTHDEVDTLFFDSDEPSAADLLDQPIGREVPVGPRKSFIVVDHDTV